jgi:glucose/mannose transport system substrate-binding protein
LTLDDVAEKQNWKTRLPAHIHDSIFHNGHYYAAPVNLQRVNWMWLNPQVFKSTGAIIPSNWEEFFQAAEKIQKAGYVPVALGDYTWQIGTLFESLVLSVGGADFYRQTFVDLDTEAFRSPTMSNVLKLLRKLKSYTDSQGEGRTWVQATEMVIEKKAAVYFMGDWVKTIMNRHKIPYGNQGYLCLPVLGTEDQFLTNIDSFAFPDSGYIYRSGQKALAEIMMKADIQEQFNLLKGSIPARQDSPTKQFDECSQISIALAKQDQFLPSFNFLQAQPRKVQKPVIDAVSAFFRSDSNISDTLDRLYQIVEGYKTSVEN